MATIYPSELVGAVGDMPVIKSVLTASDTLAYDKNRQQLLILRNPTAGQIVATVAGDDADEFEVPGLGDPVDVSGGFTITVPAGGTRALMLGTRDAYMAGVVRISAGVGLRALLLQVGGDRSWMDRENARLLDLSISLLPEA